jgi:bifunctional non-homologous end joining protein LigD
VRGFSFFWRAFDGEATLREPYRARRELLEALPLDGAHARVVPSFPDGEALYAAVCDFALEGVVAKRERDPSRPGERGWVKTKNRATARFSEELARIAARRRARS